MAASQYCAYPEYAALIVRKTYQDLALPGAIMDRAIDWWKDKHGIRWDGQSHRFTWPSGAVVQFGHMNSATDHLRYQGAELHFVGFDEGTQIPGYQLTYLHSRLRDSIDSDIPVRYRIATNPGGVSHEYVRDEYVKGADGRTRIYLPALLSENPGINQEQYRDRLARLDPITRRRLEEGDWDVHLSGGFFQVDKITTCNLSDPRLEGRVKMVRAWDLAATPESPGRDPDWTVGILMAVVGDEYWVLDMQRVRLGPGDVYDLVRSTAISDGLAVKVLVEREPGSSGVLVNRHIATVVLRGYDYKPFLASGSKYDRAKPLAAGVANALVKWSDSSLNRSDGLAEMRAFSDDPKTYAHDDMVDAMSMAYSELALTLQWSIVIP